MSFEEAVPGGKSVGVPGNVRLMAMAHQKHGKLPWAVLFEPAIRFARDGFAVTPRLHFALARGDDEGSSVAASTAAARALYFDQDGQPLAVGTIVRNPALRRLSRAVGGAGTGQLLCRPERASDRRGSQRQRAQSVANGGGRCSDVRRQAARRGVRQLSRLPHLRHGPGVVGRHHGVRDPQAARALRLGRARPAQSDELAPDR